MKTNLEEKIIKLGTKIEVIEILLDYNVSKPAESNKFPYYQDLAQQANGHELLRDELKQLRDELKQLRDELKQLIVERNLLLQEHQRGMFSI
jgi:hypothetical protein